VNHFDRYARQGVLPIADFDNIAALRAPGARCWVGGSDTPEYRIWRTQLDSVPAGQNRGQSPKKTVIRDLSDAGNAIR